MISKILVISFVFFIFLSSFASSKKVNSLKEAVENVKQALKKASTMPVQTKLKQLEDLTLECALCGIAMNEVEGLLLENRTQSDIETELKIFCSYLPSDISPLCDLLVADLPNIIDLEEKKYTVSGICTEIGMCDKPFNNPTDPQDVPTYTINLDLPPKERYKEVCSNATYQTTLKFLLNTLNRVLGDEVVGALSDLGEFLNDWYFPQDLGEEIQGCADVVGIGYGWISLFNMGYEVSDACTSIIAQDPKGVPFHVRNMDFWAGMGFTDSLKTLAYTAEYQKNGKTVFYSTTFAGYAGVLSGMKPNGFSITVDTRFYPGGITELFGEIVAALTENNASLVTFLTRQVMENENDFDAAVQNLSNDELIADVYYIVAGTKAGEGAVISRNRHNATDVWKLDASNGRWWLLETNYDHWKETPWFDDRRTDGNKHMKEMGQSNVNVDNMLKIIEQKPTLNLQTTFSSVAVPATGYYKSYSRWCEYPCVQ